MFYDFQGPKIKFHDFPGLENKILKFHDFPSLPWIVQTLIINKTYASFWGLLELMCFRGLII